jgi:hypothetical protein
MMKRERKRKCPHTDNKHDSTRRSQVYYKTGAEREREREREKCR